MDTTGASCGALVNPIHPSRCTPNARVLAQVTVRIHDCAHLHTRHARSRFLIPVLLCVFSLHTKHTHAHALALPSLPSVLSLQAPTEEVYTAAKAKVEPVLQHPDTHTHTPRTHTHPHTRTPTPAPTPQCTIHTFIDIRAYTHPTLLLTLSFLYRRPLRRCTPPPRPRSSPSCSSFRARAPVLPKWDAHAHTQSSDFFRLPM